ncbi:MAG: Lipoteichoic acid synthase 2 [Bacteroidetes bacterium]|jgi:arylsulfatase A-like enzyme|nr:Lipoteichoic acid synthase 2 [Bacteroidota bacterium]
MKRLLVFLAFLNILPAIICAQVNDTLVKQEIRYVTSEAEEMFFVWGVNNWQIAATSLRPEGSYIKDNLVFSPMKKKAHCFVVDLKVPKNTMIDYVFWISKGPAKKPVDIWDTNKEPQKDYHTMAINNNTVLIPSKLKIRPGDPVTILDFAIPLLSISTILFFFFLILRSYRFKGMPIYAGPVKIIAATAIVLSLGLVFIRSSVTGQCWDLYFHPFRSFPKVLWAGFYDVVYTLILAGVFLILLKVFRHKPKAEKYLTGSFIGLALFSFVAGILNIRVVQTIGKPFNYPWLYYSDFLKSSDAQAAVTSNISLTYCLQILMVCTAAFISVMTIILVTDILLQKLRMKGTLLSSLVCSSAIYITLAPDAIQHYNWEYNKLANPVVAFTSSLGPFSEDPELFTMDVEDSLKFDLSPKLNITTQSKKNSAIKNVIVFVMESTPAEYVQPYSGTYKITPELEKHLKESIVFDNVYAHAPATNNSMVSILGSVYPWLSYNSITKEHPDIQIPTISSELKKHGYRTAFFNSADNRFQKAGEFLANREFDNIKDCSTVECSKHFEVNDKNWDFLDGKDDICTSDDMMSWINQEKDKPFFSMMWTYQTHYPYFTSGNEKFYTPDPMFNKYLNAVNHSDQVLGKLLDDLKNNGLSESTLVVVVGDHGEAFGRHNQFNHASGIYEENLHVPCVLINPSFKGEHQPGIGGLVDLAPTIMNQLGLPVSEKWQGSDLFTKTESDRVFFFTPWADFLFGYREGDKKYIFNATKNITEMYDLKNDPLETVNIAMQYPDKTKVSHMRLAGWVQSLNTHMSALLTMNTEK